MQFGPQVEVSCPNGWVLTLGKEKRPLTVGFAPRCTSLKDCVIGSLLCSVLFCGNVMAKANGSSLWTLKLAVLLGMEGRCHDGMLMTVLEQLKAADPRCWHKMKHTHAGMPWTRGQPTKRTNHQFQPCLLLKVSPARWPKDCIVDDRLWSPQSEAPGLKAKLHARVLQCLEHTHRKSKLGCCNLADRAHAKWGSWPPSI